tara:strand:- start:475 stop:1596 length:1122 start_codon:yes stop_codon:yes gene_type:complete
MPIAGTNIPLDSTEGMDKITQTEKVTSPYFSDGATILKGTANIVSTSLSDTNETYFFGISNASTPTVPEFNVTFGSSRGHGAKVEANTKSETAAIYGQYASLLLAPTEVTGGFFISANSGLGSTPTLAKNTSKDTEIFVLSSRRSNMKDRINKGTWLIGLSGSNSAGAGNTEIFLKDDSSARNPVATPVGDRYNIVSCSSAGVIAGEGAASRTFGWFYPDPGIMIFSQQELSASIPGNKLDIADTVLFNSGSHKGFGLDGSAKTANQKLGLRFINCLKDSTKGLEFRDEEDQVSAQYFCRVRSGQVNFSNNPTFVSGSLNELRATKMKGNPQTFITSVQLYNNAGDMVAVGNLSTPLKKNFSSEATIKVKLTY